VRLGKRVLSKMVGLTAIFETTWGKKVESKSGGRKGGRLRKKKAGMEKVTGNRRLRRARFRPAKELGGGGGRTSGMAIETMERKGKDVGMSVQPCCKWY